jgi:hypothetical protein
MRRPRNLGATYFFALADPFVLVLRLLSSEYLSRARDRMLAALEGAHQRQTDWHFGWVHPGYGAVPDFDPARQASPLTFVGWISRQACGRPGSTQDHLYRELGRDLLAGEPALRWGATSSRAYWFDLPRGEDAALVALIEWATNEPSEWTPEALMAASPDPEEPIHACARAVRDHDHGAYVRALANAESTYSSAGRVLLRAGLSLTLGRTRPV